MLHSRSLLVCLALLLVLLSVKSLSAGDKDDSIYKGQRVRIHIDTVISKRFLLFFSLKHNETRKIVGHLANYTNDSISLMEDYPQGEPRMFLTESIKRLDYSTGTRRATRKGLWIGAFYGTVLSLLSRMGHPSPPDYERVPMSTVAPTLIGGCTALGGLIGWFFHHDVWTEVNKDKFPWELDVDAARGELQLRLSLSFP